MEIVQFIALSSVLIGWLAHFRYREPWRALLLALGSFLIHLAAQTADIAPFPGSKILFAPWGFPIFPWLSFCFLGIAAIGMSQRARIAAAGGSAVLFFVLLLAGFWSVEKWNMTLPYFLLGVAVMFFGFWLVSKMPPSRIPAFVVSLGNNSLLFLFVHLAWIKLLMKFDLSVIGESILLGLLAYGGVAALTVASIEVALSANRRIEPLFRYWSVWAALTVTVILFPAAPVPNGVIWLVEFACGVAFAMNYPALSALVANFVNALKYPGLRKRSPDAVV